MHHFPERGRLIGLDIGEKRIGVAICDEGQIISSPWGMVRQGTRAIAELRQIIEDHNIAGIVVGLPTGMSGHEGMQAAETRAFAELAESELGLPFSYWDERLTSAQAERVLIDAGMRRKDRRQRIDALAASLILQGYLDARINRRRRGY